MSSSNGSRVPTGAKNAGSGRSNELEETPTLAGMLRKVDHLVKVER